MKKEYVSPKIEISILESLTDILTGSQTGVGAGGVTDDKDNPVWGEWL